MGGLKKSEGVRIAGPSVVKDTHTSYRNTRNGKVPYNHGCCVACSGETR